MTTHQPPETPASPGPPGPPEPSGEPPRPRDEQPWIDLAANVAGASVVGEARRRRRVEGAGADRSWRVGADGEAAVADLLTELTGPSRWDRLRPRSRRRHPAWRVLHSVPLGDARGRERGDIDHVLVGPPGVVTVNTKHHRGARLHLDGDQLLRNGHRTEHVPKARREAERARALLAAAGAAAGWPDGLMSRLRVRPFVVLVHARLTARAYPSGVTVVMTGQLLHALAALPAALSPDDVEAVFAIARRSTTWNPPGPAAARSR